MQGLYKCRKCGKTGFRTNSDPCPYCWKPIPDVIYRRVKDAR